MNSLDVLDGTVIGRVTAEPFQTARIKFVAVGIEGVIEHTGTLDFTLGTEGKTEGNGTWKQLF